jgi:hypothetical protein
MSWRRNNRGATKADLDQMEGRIMKEIDDLKTAVARLATSTSMEIKAVSDKLTGLGPNATAADIATATAALNATADSLDAETAKLTAA